MSSSGGGCTDEKAAAVGSSGGYCDCVAECPEENAGLVGAVLETGSGLCSVGATATAKADARSVAAAADADDSDDAGREYNGKGGKRSDAGPEVPNVLSSRVSDAAR